MGKELYVNTVGELVEKITRENYLQLRRNPETFNKKEIQKILIDWFSNEFELDKFQVNTRSNALGINSQ